MNAVALCTTIKNALTRIRIQAGLGLFWNSMSLGAKEKFD